MKKKSNKFLAVLLALMMAVVFMPTLSFAAGPGNAGDQPKGAAAKEIVVKMTVNNKGVIAKTNKGAIMANKSVTVKDLNKDGKMTFDEALVAAHKAYNKKSGYAVGLTPWGTEGVAKLWGVETSNTLFLVNGSPIPTGVTVDTVKKGDKLYASVNADDVNYADWYTFFNKGTVKAYAKRDITLNLQGFQGMAGNPPAPVKDVQIGKWVKGKFVALKNVKTDDDGNVTFKFSKKGTYYVTANGTVEDVDWQGNPIDAPIMAPFCKVVVKKAKAAKPINVKMSVNNKGVIAKTSKGAIMWNKTVKVIDTNKDGKFSYNEALIAAHKAYKAKGYKTVKGEYGLQVTKLWGVKTTNTLYFDNGVPIPMNVGESFVKKNDKLYASVNADDVSGADWYTSFDKTSVKEKANREITLNLTGYQGMAGNPPAPVKDAQIGTWKKGKFVPMEGVMTDSDGNVTFTFKKAGTYYVTAMGTVEDVDWQGNPIEAPTMAPICKVVVEKAVAAAPATVELSVSNKGTFAQDNDGGVMFDREITAKDTDKNGKVTVDELLVAAHKAFNTEAGYEAPDGYVSKLWGIDNSYGYLFFVNDLPIPNGVAKDAVVTGDKVTAAIMNDTTYWSDFYAFFDTHTKTVRAGEAFVLNLQGYMGVYGPDTGAEPEETEIGLWKDGAFESLDIYADEDGNVPLLFENPGTYLVTTTCDDYQDVIAAGCLVTVTE